MYEPLTFHSLWIEALVWSKLLCIICPPDGTSFNVCAKNLQYQYIVKILNQQGQINHLSPLICYQLFSILHMWSPHTHEWQQPSSNHMSPNHTDCLFHCIHANPITLYYLVRDRCTKCFLLDPVSKVFIYDWKGNVFLSVCLQILQIVLQYR